SEVMPCVSSSLTIRASAASTLDAQLSIGAGHLLSPADLDCFQVAAIGLPLEHGLSFVPLRLRHDVFVLGGGDFARVRLHHVGAGTLGLRLERLFQPFDLSLLLGDL